MDGTGLEVSEIKIKIGIYVNILHCKVLMSEEWKGEVKHIVIDSGYLVYPYGREAHTKIAP